MVGRRTCDLGVAGSRPGRDDAAQQPRQVVYTRLPLSPSSIMFTGKWTFNRHIAWCTNPYHVVSQCSLMPGCRLACGDQRRLTGNGSALEVVLHDDALYKSTYFFSSSQQRLCCGEKGSPKCSHNLVEIQFFLQLLAVIWRRALQEDKCWFRWKWWAFRRCKRCRLHALLICSFTRVF